MRMAVRLLRFVFALSSLAAYAVLPVLGFSRQGATLYLCSGFTAGVFLTWRFCLPLAALALLCCMALGSGRWLYALCWLTSLCVLLAVVVVPWTQWFADANAVWLMGSARTLRSLLIDTVGPLTERELLAAALEAGWVHTHWGFWVALALCTLAVPLGGRRSRRRWEEDGWDE